VRPSQRKEMAEKAVRERGVSISVACRAFGISLTCYRYDRKLSDENAEIADWLERLTTAQKTSRLWSMLPISAQSQGVLLESQTGLSDLQGP
jgi:hypothetical protein